jgi:hypothetical protein
MERGRGAWAGRRVLLGGPDSGIRIWSAVLGAAGPGCRDHVAFEPRVRGAGKGRDYLDAGLRAVWVFDPPTKSATVHRPAGSARGFEATKSLRATTPFPPSRGGIPTGRCRGRGPGI